MIAYKEIDKIKNVKGINPITRDYSYEENGGATFILMVSCLRKKGPQVSLSPWENTPTLGIAMAA